MVRRPANVLHSLILNRPALCGALLGTVGIWFLESLYCYLYGQRPASCFNALLLLILGAVTGALALAALVDRRRRRLTMCVHCHAVKETGSSPGQGEGWMPSEQYLPQVLRAEVSQGLCPHCQREHYRGHLPPQENAPPRLTPPRLPAYRL